MYISPSQQVTWLFGTTRPVFQQASMMMCMAFLLTIWTSDSRADDWSQWRGPNRDAISMEKGLLRHWTGDSPEPAWQAVGLGEGYASVVISQDLVFTIGRRDNHVFCFALETETGKERWTREIDTTSRIPCSTPTVDGKYIYALDPDGDLVCLKTVNGDIVWRKSFLEDYAGQMMSGRGYGESPLIDGEKIICTPGGIETMLVAMNKHTGETLWKSTMPDIGPAGREGAGFSSIVITEVAGIRQYVQLVGRGVIGVAADDGRFLWGYNEVANPTANIPTPIVHKNLVFAANGYNVGSVLLQLEANGDGGIDAQQIYRLSGNRFQNHHGGVVLVDGYLFGGHGSNNGLPTCVELKSGQVMWKRRGPGTGSAAVVCADGHLYFRYQNGTMALIEASPEGYRLKGTFQIPGAGGDSWAHPVIAHGRLYLREKDRLWVYQITADSPTSTANASRVLQAQSTQAVTALHELGVSIEPVKFKALHEASNKERLYHYINTNNQQDSTPNALLIPIRNRHIASSGIIKSRLFRHLSELRQPFILNLAGTHLGDAGLKQISRLTSLVGLDLELCRNITDAGLRHLQNTNRLHVLLLTGTAIGNPGLKHLKPITSLLALDFEFCTGITDTSCVTLASMKQLKALILKKSGFEKVRVTDAGLEHLRKLPHLETLDLYGNHLTNAGLSHLGDMQHLRLLDLSLQPITDEGLTHLGNLRRLERLELVFSTGFSGPVITDGGLKPLLQLTNLKCLNLVGASVTDNGFKQLADLKQLVRIKVVNTQVTKHGVRQFKILLPHCDIEH